MNKEPEIICKKCGFKMEPIWIKDMDSNNDIWMRADSFYCPKCKNQIICDNRYDYKLTGGD